MLAGLLNRDRASIRKDVRTQRARGTRGCGRHKPRIGGAVTLRPRGAAHIGPEVRKSAAHIVRAEKFDFQSTRDALAAVAFEARQFLQVQRNIGVTTGREFAALADQFLDPLPLLDSAQRKRKFGWMAPFQPNVAEIDATRLAADRPLLDNGDRVAALAQEIGGPDPDQPAADDRNVAVDRAHGAVYHRARTTYICGAA